MLDANHITNMLEGCPFDIKVYDEVTSTNDLLKRAAEEGAGEWSVIVSDKQTAGRGRIGRSFFSPRGCGIYMSVLLRPGCHVSECLQITGMAAVSVVKSIRSALKTQNADQTEISDLGIKWVNDIFYNGKKICGILTEGITDENLDLKACIIGIGINVYEPAEGIPKELESIVGRIFPCGAPVEGSDIRNTIAAMILKNLLYYYPGMGDRTFLEEYKALSFLPGKPVGILTMDGELSGRGTALEVDDDLRLVVRLDYGEIRRLDSGEVRVIPD